MQHLDELIAVLSDFKPSAIADQADLSRQTVYNVLSGVERNPKTSTVLKLHQFLASKKVAIGRLLEPEI